MQPIKFQEDNVKALLSMFNGNDRILLADETGLGKTVTTALLIAGMAIRKHLQKKEAKFNVLYICSEERIARKNMGELCADLSDKKTIEQAANILGLNFSGVLLDSNDANVMARKRGSRLSMSLDEYAASFIQIYNSTPDTSFRTSNSIKVGGTKEEYFALMGKKKPPKDYKLSSEDCLEFARKRKAAVKSHFEKKNFDLLVLDEYQSYEDILPVDGCYDDNCQKDCEDELKQARTTIEDLLRGNSTNNSTKVLMLSATPYQSRTDEKNKFSDFKGILAFLSGGVTSNLVNCFGEYSEALYSDNCPFDVLLDKKVLFEKELQKYCRRNQRTDVFLLKEKGLFSNPKCMSQVENKESLRKEMIVRKGSDEIRTAYKNTAADDEDELSSSILKIQMERDTAWGYSFSKDYKYRCSGEISKELYKAVAEKDMLMITAEKEIKEENDSKRCTQSIMDGCIREGDNDLSQEQKKCKRFLNCGEPPKLCESKEWPNYKIQTIRDISTGVSDKDKDYPALYNCIWLPASAPDYEPDQDSPFYKYFKKNPSKTIVFSRYKMTTRSIAALISVEAAKGGGKLNFTDDDWDFFQVKPQVEPNKTDGKIIKGHPYLCAYNALKDIKEEDCRDYYSERIAEEMVKYFKRDEIQAVLVRAGVKNKDDLLKYCKDGNLTAVLREYLSTKRIDYSTNGILIYASKRIDRWKRLSAAKKLEKIYRLAWEEMNEADPNKILKEVLKNGFKPEYIDNNEEPYNGLKNGKPDGFEAVRIAAWKTWVAYQMTYGDKNLKEKLNEKMREAIGRAIEKEIAKGEIRQKSFNYSYCICYEGISVNGKTIDAHTIESYIMHKNFIINRNYETYWFVKYGVPKHYNDLNIHGEHESISENDFFEEGIRVRTKEKDGDLKKSNLDCVHLYKYARACNTPLFNGGFGTVTHDIWDDLDDKQSDRILDFMPEMHVCADFKIDDTVKCGRIPLGFASRYTNEIQDSNDHNDNAAEEVMNAFNGPFYPFVLAVTDTAKEGLNFHTYCRRLIHLNIPDRPAVLIQREGRIDRFRSLVLRQRLAKKDNITNWEKAWADENDKNASGNSNGMIPNWYIESNDGPMIEKYYLVTEGTTDRIKVGNIERDAELYKRMLGSFLEKELIDNLSRRYPGDDISKLKLFLIP